MRLRAGLRVLRRAPDEVQVGTDPRWAMRLTGLAPGEVDLLLSIDDGATKREVSRLARSLGVPLDRLEALQAELDRAQLTTPKNSARRAPAAATQARHDPFPARLGPDAAVWGRLLDGGDGAGLVAARGRRVVGIAGAGRVGLTTAVTLAVAGVGTVLIEDESPVTPSDLGLGGYTARDLTSPRRVAVARLLRDLAPEVRTFAPEHTRPDVMVLIEHGAADALRAHVLMSTAVVHLSVVVREADVVVGPLVLPGASACLHCLDLHRTGADDRWPTLAAQLIGTTPRAGTDEETVLAAIAGSLAAGQVLALLDGTGPRTVDSSLEVSLPEGVPRLRAWSRHPACGCADLPSAALRRADPPRADLPRAARSEGAARDRDGSGGR